MKIKTIRGLEVLDSRGNPTVRAFVTLDDNTVHSASVPSGASTGTHEALELRDDDSGRYGGKGVLVAVDHVSTAINDLLRGSSLDDPASLDKKMLELDGTPNKSRLGANALLAVSMAIMRAGAHAHGIPLWKFFHDQYFSSGTVAFPRLMVNIENGGVHADWNFDFQEFMLIPTENTPSQSVRVASEVFHSLGKLLRSRKLQTLVGDEGGYSPALSSNDEAVMMLVESARSIGYANTIEYNIGLDCAASEFYADGAYELKKENKKFTRDELLAFYMELQKKHALYSFEDPFYEDDWESFQKITQTADGQFLVVGDDLFVTNKTRLQKGISMNAASAILVKLNQIGTVWETVEAISMAREAGYKVIISHRSGETEDAFIADLAYGCGADFIKTGSMSRSDRLAKYNRLLEIEAGL